ncbi:hypothetical protein BP00DRAFT_192520 [Aspergillus indologenus CBS 114.80]|uniref:Uncharacterized protein n=1 Tax=Aspergillus indologenus CBS 114.80 TaxID=1450541 RepID=A0A2V5I216_9EURO|nr:hypothetical protein BP00DRAFT_192520 [Aspergillus indologenus CBS 114.80]
MIQRPWSNSFLSTSMLLLSSSRGLLIFPPIFLGPPLKLSRMDRFNRSTWFMFIHLRSSIDYFPPKVRATRDRQTGERVMA